MKPIGTLVFRLKALEGGEPNCPNSMILTAPVGAQKIDRKVAKKPTKLNK